MVCVLSLDLTNMSKFTISLLDHLTIEYELYVRYTFYLSCTKSRVQK